MLGRQALFHLSHSASEFIYFHQREGEFVGAELLMSHLCVNKSLGEGLSGVVEPKGAQYDLGLLLHL
jgi:hypothetical protein